jgi:hypothetical protein
MSLFCPPPSRFTGVESALQMFVTEGEEGNLGGKTAEPSVSSSEATGFNETIVMSGHESTVLGQRAVTNFPRPG